MAGDTPDPIDIHAGARMRVRRKQIGFSQERLASALHLTFQQVQKYERGANRISASKLFRIAQTLDVPIGYFFEGLEDLPDGTGAQAAQTEAMEVAIAVPSVKAILRLPRSQQLALETVIAGIVQLYSPETKPNA